MTMTMTVPMHKASAMKTWLASVHVEELEWLPQIPSATVQNLAENLLRKVKLKREYLTSDQ